MGFDGLWTRLVFFFLHPESIYPQCLTACVSLCGLGVTCSPRDPKFAGSNSAEVDVFFSERKNPKHYRERKIRRNALSTNLMQGQVRCCQVWGRRRKREENHMSGP